MRRPIWISAVAIASVATFGLGLVLVRDAILASGMNKLEPALGLTLLITVAAASVIGDVASALVFELLLAILLAGTVIGDQGFAHLSVPLGSLPLYVTDYLLALLVMSVALQPRWRQMAEASLRRSGVYFGAYLAWGTLILVLSLHRNLPLVLRDYALFYSAVFIAIGHFAKTADVSLKRLGAVGVAACIIVFVHGAHNLLSGDTQTLDYGISRSLTGQAGMYLGLGAILSLAILPFVKGPIRFLFGLFMAICMVGLFLSESRSAWIAILFGLIVIVSIGRHFRIRLPYLGEAVAGSAVILVGFTLSIAGINHFSAPIRPSPVAQVPTPQPSVPPTGTPTQATPSSPPSPSSLPSPSPKPPDIGGSFGRLGTGLGDPASDPTVAWRLDGWREALRHIQMHPITGDRFGTQFSWHTAGRLVENYPHNTYLTIALKSGIPGLLLLGAPVIVLLWRAVKMSGRFNCELSGAALLGVTASVSALLMFGTYNLLFESPYLAWPTWAMIGLVLAMSDRETPAEHDSRHRQ